MSALDLIRGPVPSATPDRDKWLKLEQLPRVDAGQPHVQHLADALWTIALAAPRERRVWAFAHLVHCLTRDCIRYSSDVARTGAEDIAGLTRPYGDPLEALERGNDDCDAKARLFVALCLARRVPAHLVPWWSPTTGHLAHVSAEVAIDGRWVPVETILARARLGDAHARVPTESESGKGWLYS